MIFWGAPNIAGERSLKIPYSTIAVKAPIGMGQEGWDLLVGETESVNDWDLVR